MTAAPETRRKRYSRTLLAAHSCLPAKWPSSRPQIRARPKPARSFRWAMRRRIRKAAFPELQPPLFAGDRRDIRALARDDPADVPRAAMPVRRAHFVADTPKRQMPQRPDLRQQAVRHRDLSDPEKAVGDRSCHRHLSRPAVCPAGLHNDTRRCPQRKTGRMRGVARQGKAVWGMISVRRPVEWPEYLAGVSGLGPGYRIAARRRMSASRNNR